MPGLLFKMNHSCDTYWLEIYCMLFQMSRALHFFLPRYFAISYLDVHSNGRMVDCGRLKRLYFYGWDRTLILTSHILSSNFLSPLHCTGFNQRLSPITVMVKSVISFKRIPFILLVKPPDIMEMVDLRVLLLRTRCPVMALITKDIIRSSSRSSRRVTVLPGSCTGNIQEGAG